MIKLTLWLDDTGVVPSLQLFFAQLKGQVCSQERQPNSTTCSTQLDDPLLLPVAHALLCIPKWWGIVGKDDQLGLPQPQRLECGAIAKLVLSTFHHQCQSRVDTLHCLFLCKRRWKNVCNSDCHGARHKCQYTENDNTEIQFSKALLEGSLSVGSQDARGWMSTVCNNTSLMDSMFVREMNVWSL